MEGHKGLSLAGLINCCCGCAANEDHSIQLVYVGVVISTDGGGNSQIKREYVLAVYYTVTSALLKFLNGFFEQNATSSTVEYGYLHHFLVPANLMQKIV